MANRISGGSALFLSCLGFLLLIHSCFGQIADLGGSVQRQQRHPLRFRSECRLENLHVLEPSRRIEAEAGYTELWDEKEEALTCAGSAFTRHVIRRNGLFLPSYSNSAELMYVVQGRGLYGVTMPGCPETYQSDESQFRGRQGTSEREGVKRFFGDRHQKVREIREGDIVAQIPGTAFWIHNKGQSDLVLISVIYTSNEQNQLDQNIRKFFLAGNPQEGSQGGRRHRTRGSQQETKYGNVFQGFDDELLQETFDVESDLARKVKGEDDRRGHIVEVREELQIVHPMIEQGEGWEEREREREREREMERGSSRRRGSSSSQRQNGAEETLCTMRLRENIDNPERADYYNPRAGRITTLNSFSLPILSFLQLSAEKGILYKDAVVAPSYYMNSHAVIYVLRGNARVQIAGDNGQSVFDGKLQENQVLVVPQNFAVIKKAGSEGFEWVAFRTSDNAMKNNLAGRLSVIRGLPEDVLVNSYGISRDDARKLKYNREELTVFSPASRSARGLRRDDAAN
ncbi:hypothetical protein SAY86_030515 [Trapa natans]|uniref:Cupin type-1 domain-containing protein n=1 Tax=Trapa natans TaxID=22666 RepID=A0AAN7M3X0_TRANT|nr:hypothetical protein SAY86_030515 [Trapa natans]